MKVAPNRVDKMMVRRSWRALDKRGGRGLRGWEEEKKVREVVRRERRGRRMVRIVRVGERGRERVVLVWCW